MKFLVNNAIEKQHRAWCEKAVEINLLLADKKGLPEGMELGQSIVDYALDKLRKELLAPPMPKVKPLKDKSPVKVMYCGEQYLELRLNSIVEEGGDVVSVTWQGVPHSRFVVVYRGE